MSWLKQSTAVTVKVGPFVDATDGATAETGLTISQADVRLSKNGGNMAQKNSAAVCTHDELGVYDCALDATDTGTLGRLDLFVHEGGALPVWLEFMVLPANVYDSLVGGSDTLAVDVTAWDGTAVAAQASAGYPVVTLKVGQGTGELNVAGGKVELVDDAVNANTMALNAIGSDALAASAITEIQSGLATAASLTTLAGYVDTEITSILATLASGVPLTSAAVDAILDEIVEGSTTMRQAMRLLLAALAGKAAGGGTNTVTFRDLADTKDRLTMTTDANGNRTAVTRDAS